MKISEMMQKIQNFFSLLDNCIWVVCCKFSLLRREYLSSVYKVLTNSPQISDITRRTIFELDFPDSDKKDGQEI